MALMKCPECGKEISDKAVSCPNCGFPISKDKKKKLSHTITLSKLNEFSHMVMNIFKNILHHINVFWIKLKASKKMQKCTVLFIGIVVSICVIYGAIIYPEYIYPKYIYPQDMNFLANEMNTECENESSDINIVCKEFEKNLNENDIDADGNDWPTYTYPQAVEATKKIIKDNQIEEKINKSKENRGKIEEKYYKLSHNSNGSNKSNKLTYLSKMYKDYCKANSVYIQLTKIYPPKNLSEYENSLSVLKGFIGAADDFKNIHSEYNISDN